MFGEINVDSILAQVADQGAALITNAIGKRALSRLNCELAALRLIRAKETIGTVQQSFERIAFLRTLPSKLPALNALRTSMEFFLQSSKSFPQLKNWQAMDTVVQKYGQNDFLTAHKDLYRHPLVIAICTAAGSCEFELLEKRSGPVLQKFRLQAGYLLLLRAPGLTDAADDRPFHQVSGSCASSPRISITFRANTEPDKAIPGFGYENI